VLRIRDILVGTDPDPDPHGDPDLVHL
jgi:hypothetical protein